MGTELFILLFSSFAVLALAGLPLAYSLFFSALAAMTLASDLPPELIVQQAFRGIDAFPILAIPIFFFAGDLLNRGQVSEYLIRLCMAFVGWVRGALAYFSVIVAMIFAGTTGSSAAESAAIGSVFIPNLVKRGYGPAFSSALVASASVVGIIIPPSTFMIIYGSFGNVSVTALFVAGILPGVALGLVLMVISFFYARHYDYPRESESMASLREMAVALRTGIWPLGAPVLLIGGMTLGFFTPTEASLATVLYTLVLVLVLYRTLRLRELPEMLRTSAVQASAPLFCLAFASVYGYLMALYKIPERAGDAVLSVTSSPGLILLFLIALLLVVGTFIDGTPAIIILLPITQKIGEVAGLHPLHLGLVVCTTIALGLLTPPYGLCTLISCAIGGVEVTDVLRPMLPMFLAMLAVVLGIAFLPDAVLFLPRLLVPDLVP